jgi:hypothetical protein
VKVLKSFSLVVLHDACSQGSQALAADPAACACLLSWRLGQLHTPVHDFEGRPQHTGPYMYMECSWGPDLMQQGTAVAAGGAAV